MIFGTFYDLMVDEEGNTGAYRFVGHFKSKKDLEYEKKYLRKRYPKSRMDSKFRICVDGNVQTQWPNGKPYSPLHYRSPITMFVGLAIMTVGYAFSAYFFVMAVITYNGF